VPQGRRIFSSLAVAENLEVPYRSNQRDGRKDDIKKIFERFPVLWAKKIIGATNFSEVGNRCQRVEQNLSLAPEVSDYVHVMSKGRIVYHYTQDDLWRNEEVEARHLGI
jgi:ABC-type branched-subunit amino acid transport system ATPase component